MEALTGDTRFTELVEELLERQREGKEIVMCEYIDMLEARGEARGISIGERRGEAKGENRLADLIQILLKEKKYGEIETVAGNRDKRLGALQKIWHLKDRRKAERRNTE